MQFAQERTGLHIWRPLLGYTRFLTTYLVCLPRILVSTLVSTIIMTTSLPVNVMPNLCPVNLSTAPIPQLVSLKTLRTRSTDLAITNTHTYTVTIPEVWQLVLPASEYGLVSSPRIFETTSMEQAMSFGATMLLTTARYPDCSPFSKLTRWFGLEWDLKLSLNFTRGNLRGQVQTPLLL